MDINQLVQQEQQYIQKWREMNEQKSKLPIYYGVMTIGPSGSGKSTFCNGLQQFFEQVGRKHLVINLDPANENIFYNCNIDIRDLIQLEDVMEEFQLGPNGALLYCIEFLEKNIQWLIDEIQKYKGYYLIFDLPGQIELYLNSQSMRNILEKLKYSQQFQCELVLCELFDSHYCYDKNLFISICLQALTSMMNLELPHINILSKIDLMSQIGKPDLDLQKYMSPYDIGYLFENQQEDSNFSKRYKGINKFVYELVENENQVSFLPLDIQNKILLSNLISNIDKANGYFYTTQKKSEKFDAIRSDIAKTSQLYQNQSIYDLEQELFHSTEKQTLIQKVDSDQKNTQQTQKNQNKKKNIGFGGFKKGFFN